MIIFIELNKLKIQYKLYLCIFDIVIL